MPGGPGVMFGMGGYISAAGIDEPVGVLRSYAPAGVAMWAMGEKDWLLLLLLLLFAPGCCCGGGAYGLHDMPFRAVGSGAAQPGAWGEEGVVWL